MNRSKEMQNRFPEDFVFQLTEEEEELICQMFFIIFKIMTASSQLKKRTENLINFNVKI